MFTRQATIASSVGLHARPANIFIKAVAATGVPVTIAKVGGAPVDARSLLLVMTQGIKNGDVVTLAAEGEGAEAALDSLVELLETDLDELP
ncbi:MAG: HPr family phosphocarrier protein [Propionibacteriaceae bacterium]|nr:HPr family phosphocarrier protein [Propionibacteriaceae bacterium]